MQSNQTQQSTRIIRAAAWAGILVFLAGLAYFAYAGVYSRYWADDYCYTAAVKQNGLLNGIVEWYRASGNRVSTLVVVALVDGFGWQSIEVSPLAVLVLWTGAWIFFLARLARRFRWTVSRAWLALLALIEVYFAVLLAPDRLQTVYWRMGTYHYTLPIPLLLINLGLLAGGSCQTGRRAVLTGAASAALSFFAAGLSETFAALQAGVLALALAAALRFVPRGQRRREAGWLAASLGGTLLMMALMALSPSNAWRQDAMPPPENLLLIAPYSLRYAGDFIVYTLRGQITPFLVYVALMGALGLLAVPAGPGRLSLKAGLAGAGVSLLGTYALIVCSVAPSAYAGLSYPAQRALMPAGIVLLAGLGCAALLTGQTLRSAVPQARQGWVWGFAAVMVILLSLYPLRAMAVTRKDIDRLATWSARWDARDQQIRQSVAEGNLNVTVRQVEVVRGLEDIGPDANFWVNQCAAGFYGAGRITAEP